MNQISLIENLDNQIINIRTKSLDVSFNELSDMYSNGELIINPEYQRLFRWDPEKQSRFIESLLLEMPVPPIFVVEKEDGIYELIDGLQRISSYLNFRGLILKNTSKTDSPLILRGCDIVEGLNNLTYETIPKALQIKLKRSSVRMEVIRKTSEPSLKYHMFKRLNNGGETLSDQEIRNCTIRLFNSSAIDFISSCSQNANFKNVISTISKEKIDKKFEDEIVLRFFALKNDLDNYKNPFPEFLTTYLEKMTNIENKFDFKSEKMSFAVTFRIIDDILGKNAFSTIGSKNLYKNDFAAYFFDAISVAISNHAVSLNKIQPPLQGVVFSSPIRAFFRLRLKTLLSFHSSSMSLPLLLPINGCF